MAGFYARGAALGCTLLLDGYVATAAALVAERRAPGTRHRMIAGHRSAEPGHAAALAAIGARSGARMGRCGSARRAARSSQLPLLDAAAALLNDVARLDAIGAERAD